MIRGGESDRRVSRGELQGLPDDVNADGVFTGECPVGLKDEGNGFFEVRPGFIKGRPLCVGTRQFLHIRDVPAGDRAIHRRELDGHATIIPPSGWGV